MKKIPNLFLVLGLIIGITHAMVLISVVASADDTFAEILPPIPPESSSFSEQTEEETAGNGARRLPPSEASCEITGNWIVDLIGESCHIPTGFCGPYSYAASFRFEADGSSFVGWFPDPRDVTKVHVYEGTIDGNEVSGSWTFPLFMGPECDSMFMFYATGSFTGTLTDCDRMNWTLDSYSWAHWWVEDCTAAPEAYFYGDATVKRVCDPPLDIYADDVKTRGFIEATISDVGLEDEKLKGDVLIENSVHFWLEVNSITPSPPLWIEFVPDEEAGLAGWFAHLGLIPPCGGGVFVECTNPGRAAWVARFCSPGEIGIELVQGPRAFGLTLASAITGELFVDYSMVIGLADELEEKVPKFAEAMECFYAKGRSGFFCAGRAIRELARDPEQREEARQILEKYKIYVATDKIFSHLMGAGWNLIRTAAEEVGFVNQTIRNRTYPYMNVNVIGE